MEYMWNVTEPRPPGQMHAQHLVGVDPPPLVDTDMAALVRLVVVLAAAGSLDPACDKWRLRWNHTRTVRQFIDFIHIPKAAGHSVEAALKLAFHGPNKTGNVKCHLDTSDCINYHGGHTASFWRPRRRDYEHVSQITVLREPISKLLSSYDDIRTMLSTSTCNHSSIQYCSGHHADFCQPGTGWNTEAVRRHGRGSTPCVPAQSRVAWAIAQNNESSPSHTDAVRRSQAYLTGARASSADLRSDAHRWQARSRFRRYLEQQYALVGVTTRESVAEYLRRLQYAFATPFDATPQQVPPSPPAPAAEPSMLESSMTISMTGPAPSAKPSPVSLLSEAARAAIANAGSMIQLEVLLYQAALEVDEEPLESSTAFQWPSSGLPVAFQAFIWPSTDLPRAFL